MMAKPEVMEDGGTVTIRVPIAIRKRGGRKLVLVPNGTQVSAAPISRYIDNAMVKAIARAFRWREMLESGQYSTIREIAKADNINESYVSRLLRLTLLAPDIVEAIFAGRQSPKITLALLMRPFPADWNIQHSVLVTSASVARLSV